MVGRVLLSEISSDSPLPSNVVLIRDSMELLDQQFREPFTRACEQVFSLKNPGAISLANNALEKWSTLFGTIRSYEAWKLHGEWLQQTNPKMAEAIKGRFLACGKVTQAECEQAREERQLVVSYLNELLSDSVLCVPVVCGWAPEAHASEKILSDNRRKNLLLNSIASFGGLPQLVIPIAIPNEQRKFAISLIAAAGKDAALLEFAEHKQSNF
jgi:amidase